jgi:sugar phosphate isomerase/epimerase
MKIGIYDLNECSSLDYMERLQIYKGVGFSGVGLYLDENYMVNNESYLDIIDYARSIGLCVEQVHIDYKISNLICENPDLYFEYVEGKLKECISLGIPYLVLHASKGDNAPSIDNEGLNRLRDLMKKYEDNAVYLCFENVRDNRNLEVIMEANINNVGMCYDLGHAYCYDNEYYLYEKYKEKILCTHLHNNYKKDTHNNLLDGEIDCKNIIKKLNKNKNINNCLEIFPPREEKLDLEQFIMFVANVYKEYKKCLRRLW